MVVVVDHNRAIRRVGPGPTLVRPDVRFDHGPEFNENGHHVRRESIVMVKQQSKKKRSGSST